jgi:hypothetical protein
VLIALHAANATNKVRQAASAVGCLPLLQVNGLINEGPGKTKMRMSDFHFKPMKTLLGRPSTEKIAGWRTQVSLFGSRRTAQGRMCPCKCMVCSVNAGTNSTML